MNRRGLTVVEVMVTIAILAVVLVAVTTILVSTSKELNVSIPAVDLETHLDRTAGRLRVEVEDASKSLVTVSADGRWISYAVPVEVEQSWGVGGDAQVRYGAKLGALETNGGLNALIFEESTVPGASPVSEADVISGGLNLNVNTEETPDTQDTYRLGHITLVYDPDGSFPTLSEDEVWMALTGDWVVQVANDDGDFGQDIDGDGVADPLFTLNGSSVEINLWGLAVAKAEKTPLMVNSKPVVTLGNP